MHEGLVVPARRHASGGVGCRPSAVPRNYVAFSQWAHVGACGRAPVQYLHMVHAVVRTGVLIIHAGA